MYRFCYLAEYPWSAPMVLSFVLNVSFSTAPDLGRLYLKRKPVGDHDSGIGPYYHGAGDRPRYHPPRPTTRLWLNWATVAVTLLGNPPCRDRSWQRVHTLRPIITKPPSVSQVSWSSLCSYPRIIRSRAAPTIKVLGGRGCGTQRWRLAPLFAPSQRLCRPTVCPLPTTL